MEAGEKIDRGDAIYIGNDGKIYKTNKHTKIEYGVDLLINP